MRRSDIRRSIKTVLLFGKGKKEREVPIGDMAINAVDKYLESCRPKLANSKSNDFSGSIYKHHTK